MSLESLVATAELVGAVAVVLSLIYVGYQVRQNTKALRTQVHETLVGHVFDSEGALLANADLARIIIKANSKQAPLTPDEQLRANTYFTFEFVNWESAYLHRKQGFIQDRAWQRWDRSSHPDDDSQGHFDYWLEHRDWFDSAFADHVDRVYRDRGYSAVSTEAAEKAMSD